MGLISILELTQYMYVSYEESESFRNMRSYYKSKKSSLWIWIVYLVAR